MREFIKRFPWGLVTFVLQVGLMLLLWLHTMSVKAAVEDRLKSYATREYVIDQARYHAEWSSEAVKRIDDKMDDMLSRIKRIEDNQIKGRQ
jgi:hypothetical protein